MLSQLLRRLVFGPFDLPDPQVWLTVVLSRIIDHNITRLDELMAGLRRQSSVTGTTKLRKVALSDDHT